MSDDICRQWSRVSKGLLPPEKRVVLLNIQADSSYPACVVAGYVKKYSDGGFYFVTPGANVQQNREVMYWSDCLGDDFQCPLWENKIMNKQ